MSASLKKLHKGEEVTSEDMSIIVTFVDTFSTVSLHPALIGSAVASIASKVNQHRHTKTCRKYSTHCRFNFPKLPSYNTIIAKPPGKSTLIQEVKKIQAVHNTVIKKVREVLQDKEVME